MIVRRLEPSDLDTALPDLTEILWAAVSDGASVGFIHPFPRSEARAYWTNRVFPAVSAGDVHLFVAETDHHPQMRFAGTVQLALPWMPNQRHRADVAKMLVHPDYRRRGMARALLAALEAEARTLGRTQLVLDTRSGDPAERLYAASGYCRVGEIPDFCRHPSDNRTEPTTYYHKALA
jgi:ribosomal protein S18 acetylase RimI-like enzyme